MEVINFTEFRGNLKQNLDKVSDDKEIVVIARSKDKNVVLLPLSEYNSWIETIHLMQSDRNRQRLEESLLEMNKGNFYQHQLLEE
jgi:antitoxin YefM